MSFQLRIIQSGGYLIRAAGAAASVSVQVFGLPTMRPVGGADSLYRLSAGDYLLILKSDRAQRIRYCIAPEDSREECLRTLQEQE